MLRVFRGLGSHNLNLKVQKKEKKKYSRKGQKKKKQILNEVREFNQKEGAHI